MKKQQKGNEKLQFSEFCTLPCLLAAFYVSVTADLYPLLVFILFFFFLVPAGFLRVPGLNAVFLVKEY